MKRTKLGWTVSCGTCGWWKAPIQSEGDAHQADAWHGVRCPGTVVDCEVCDGEGRVRNESSGTRQPSPDGYGPCGYCGGKGKVHA